MTSVVRTSITHVSANARQSVGDENRDVVKGVKYLATLDGRTTLICATLDGLTDPGDLGEARPPMHLNCRSTITYVLKSAKELGIRVGKLPEGTRQTMDGKVPASLNYDAWLRRQPQAFQREVLGPTRFDLFKDGMSLKKFVDQNHKPLSLAALEKLAA